MKRLRPELLDPVVAYDRIAQDYADFSLRRKAYLEKIEELIIARVLKGADSLLDIGAGAGERTMRIAHAAAIKRVVLLEPSAEMRKGAAASCDGASWGIWPIRAEELNPQENKFDVITCLWNVLGHIPTANRIDVLKRCQQALSPNGLFFLDVNHRYNMRAYGFWPTTARILYDHIFPSVKNGDVVMRWKGLPYNTYGHVFRQNEMQTLIESSGLKVVEKVFVDYQSGEIQGSGFEGNLFYALRRNA
ncbi:MAG TPA: class I SAM-dependent methyltransferase [Terriglobales bacterium]|jgi:2-polyprenyl-3-methyl-5-hydroxy-6-metoxy-1,4-benzoquinol methylase